MQVAYHQKACHKRAFPIQWSCSRRECRGATPQQDAERRRDRQREEDAEETSGPPPPCLLDALCPGERHLRGAAERKGGCLQDDPQNGRRRSVPEDAIHLRAAHPPSDTADDPPRGLDAPKDVRFHHRPDARNAKTLPDEILRQEGQKWSRGQLHLRGTAWLRGAARRSSRAALIPQRGGMKAWRSLPDENSQPPDEELQDWLLLRRVPAFRLLFFEAQSVRVCPSDPACRQAYLAISFSSAFHPDAIRCRALRARGARSSSGMAAERRRGADEDCGRSATG